MSKVLIPSIIGLLLLIPTSSVFADPIPSLFSSGVDAAGNPLLLGSPDPHYDVVENTNQDAVVMDPPHPSYYPNNANSQWIWENSNGLPTFVTRTFSTTFDLTGLDPSTVQIDMLVGTDNFLLDIVLNGASIGAPPGVSFVVPTPISINSGFQSSINTLEFVVQDVGSISGFRVEIVTADADPEDPRELVVGGEIIPIESTSLILAGAQSFSWMIPVLVSGIGIGSFVISRKSEN